MSFLHTPLDRDTWNRFLFQNKFLHFDRYPFGKDFSLLRKSWDKQQLTEMVDILWKEEKLAKSVNYFLCGFGHWKWLYSFTVKPVYNGPVRSGHTVYYCNRTTSQNFHWPYISCKVELYIAVTLYITVTLPFPKGDRCTQVWPVVPGWPIQAFRLWRWCERCEQKKQRVGWEWRFPPISFFLSSSHHPSYFFPASDFSPHSTISGADLVGGCRGVYLGSSTLPLFRTNICLTFAVHSFVSYWTSTFKSTPGRWFGTRSAILTGVLQALVLHH